MQFSNNANAKRQLFEPDNAVFQSDNVIADFPKVFRAAIHYRTRLRRQQLAECGLSALDLNSGKKCQQKCQQTSRKRL